MKLRYTGEGCNSNPNFQGGVYPCQGSALGYEPVDAMVCEADSYGNCKSKIYATETGLFMGDDGRR